MRRGAARLGIALLLVAGGWGTRAFSQDAVPPAPSDAAPEATTSEPETEPAFDVEAAITRLEATIAGHEDEPAGTVFENVEIFKQVPAAKLLRIMQHGFDRSLGVTCIHCHDPEHWDADSKEPKKTARGMLRLVQQLNHELLPQIDGLGDRNPTVNCTTCHRGQKKPALELEAKPDAS